LTIERPKRIQRRRTKGWRIPAGAVYVGRPTKWGNPFSLEAFGDAAIPRYRSFLVEKIKAGALDLAELRGKDLACWCSPGALCHADVLLDRANGFYDSGVESLSDADLKRRLRLTTPLEESQDAARELDRREVIWRLNRAAISDLLGLCRRAAV